MYHGWLALFILLMIALLIYVGVTMGPSGKSHQKEADNGDLEESFVKNMKYL
jgi:hypothetical protein